ncbi:hypothetical protein FBU30_001411 [Linnemannia zychae]|nr:hypothetical protein FBU30_001411 [Linnemannia zychae]
MPLLTLSAPPAVVSAIVVATSSASSVSSTLSPASSTSQLPSLSPSLSAGSPTSSDISSSSLASPASPASPSSSSPCTKPTAQSTRRVPVGPEQIGRRMEIDTESDTTATGTEASEKLQSSFLLSQSILPSTTTTTTLPTSLTPSTFVGMKKPLLPAVLTSHTVNDGGRRGSGGGGGLTSAATITTTATESPSDAYPMVGRDVLLGGYGSLSDVVLTVGSDIKSITTSSITTAAAVVEPSKLRPMSSMEYVEFTYWSPTSTPSTPTEASVAAKDGRTVASFRSRFDPSSLSSPTAAGLNLNRQNTNTSSCPAGSESHTYTHYSSVPQTTTLSNISTASSYNKRFRNESSNSNNRNSNRHRQNSDRLSIVGRVSVDQQSIHPLQMDPDLATTAEEEEEVGEGSEIGGENTMLINEEVSPEGSHDIEHNSSSPHQQHTREQQTHQVQHHVIRKKNSFAAKLRKVFNNSKSLPPIPNDDNTSFHGNNAPTMTVTATAGSTVSQHVEQTQEDIISLISGDDHLGTNGGKILTQTGMVAFMDQQQNQHRGSISSASSVDTAVELHKLHHVHSAFRRGSSQTETPSTSPDATPCGSPTDKSNLNDIMPVNQQETATLESASAPVSILSTPVTQENDSNDNIPYNRHTPSGSVSSSSPSILDMKNNTVHILPTSQTAADIASTFQSPPPPPPPHPPEKTTATPTRTVKKRLSFASISSFFSPRNGSNAAAQEARAKQQRASSVPHIENPLVTVGRQIAEFQRRHSLNDLHDNKVGKVSRVGVNPSWEKSQNSPPAATTAEQAINSSNSYTSPLQTGAPSKPIKKLSLNSVFNKSLRKKKNTVSTKPEIPLPAKPLRSALANKSNQAGNATSPPKVHMVHRSASRRRRESDDQLADGHQQPFTEEGYSSSSDEFELCTSPISVEASSGLSSPLDTYGRHFSHFEQSQDGQLTSSMRLNTELTGPLDSSNSEGISFGSSSDDMGSCSSSSCSSKQDPVAPESVPAMATTAISTASEITGSSSGSRRSSDDQSDDGFNPLLPASAARISVNRIPMETQQYACTNNGSDGQNDSALTFKNECQSSKSNNGGNENFYNHRRNVPITTTTVDGIVTITADLASTGSNASTEVSSNSSTTRTSATSSTKKGVAIMNTVAENVSEEEAMMHAQLAYIQQQQQQYLVQQSSPYQHQTQHHHHHHHVHYLPQDYNQHQHPTSTNKNYSPSHDHEPIPSQPHHHQPYYYPHPSLFPPRPPRQLQFSTQEPLVFPTWTPEQYDRTSDAYITASRLTPAMANKIKLELNQFKAQEMLVHEDSRDNTHFFI